MIQCIKNVRITFVHEKVIRKNGVSKPKRFMSSNQINQSGKQTLSPPSRPIQQHAFPSFDITFLGSGGSSPSRYRAMPCMNLVMGK